MKRSAHLKRSGFKSKAPPRPPKAEVKPSKVKASACRMADMRATLSVPAPKFPYVRDERLRDMCRAMPCQHCRAAGPLAGVTWAHSNWAEHGKGRGIKASDVFIAALCQD